MEAQVTSLIQSFHKTTQNDPDENEKRNHTAVMAAHLTRCMPLFTICDKNFNVLT